MAWTAKQTELQNKQESAANHANGTLNQLGDKLHLPREETSTLLVEQICTRSDGFLLFI